MNRLRELYDQMATSSVHAQDYRGAISDVAFDIITADSFLAGIASAIINRNSPDTVHLRSLKRSLLEGTYWILTNGEKGDLLPYPELLRHARLLEEVRAQCLKQCSS